MFCSRDSKRCSCRSPFIHGHAATCHRRPMSIMGLGFHWIYDRPSPISRMAYSLRWRQKHEQKSEKYFQWAERRTTQAVSATDGCRADTASRNNDAWVRCINGWQRTKSGAMVIIRDWTSFLKPVAAYSTNTWLGGLVIGIFLHQLQPVYIVESPVGQPAIYTSLQSA